MRRIISLICLLVPILSFASPNEELLKDIRADAPDQHVVVKGDTLWDITGKFFKKPWKWPKIWEYNKEHIKNPHWIYPGDIIYFDKLTGRLGFNKFGNGLSKLSPRIREGQSDYDHIPTIPAKDIAPFLSQPLVIDPYILESAPVIVGAREGRVMLGQRDVAFVKGIDQENGSRWQVYRPGKSFIDPDTQELLGIEAVYLGEAEVVKFAEISTTQIVEAKQEIYKGDRLVLFNGEIVDNYLPRAPEMDIDAKIISIYNGVSQAGQNSIVTLNKGARDGLEPGHVLALYHHGEETTFNGEKITLPDEQFGMLLVFRVFDKVAYGLVMETRLPVELLDLAVKP